MRYATLSIIAMCTACMHDVDSLKPGPDDIDAWLMNEGDKNCHECIKIRCEDQTTACIQDDSCNATFRDCYPPHPECGTISPIHYDFGGCITLNCKDECFRNQSLSCLGNYYWPSPPNEPQIPFAVTPELFGRAMDGLGGVVPLLEVCSGPQCQVDASAPLNVGKQARVSYRWNRTLRQQPYLRVSGDGIQTALLFEDLLIPKNYPMSAVVLLQEDYQLMQLAIGVSETDNGTINATFFDCSAASKAGIQFELQQKGKKVTSGVPYYFSGTTPSTGLTTTTDPTRMGGIADLPQGSYDVLALEAKTGRLVGIARDVLVRPDTLTHVNIMPLSDGEP